MDLKRLSKKEARDIRIMLELLCDEELRDAWHLLDDATMRELIDEDDALEAARFALRHGVPCKLLN